jgi:hypothetical protein
VPWLASAVLVGAGADEVELPAIVGGALLHQARDLHFIETYGNGAEIAVQQLGRDFIEKIGDALDTDSAEHLGDVVRRVRNERHREGKSLLFADFLLVAGRIEQLVEIRRVVRLYLE